MKKLILFFITTFLFLLPQKAEAQVPVQDSLALVAFYNSTNGANWTNNTNWLNGQVSTWAGINVNLGRVYTINLSFRKCKLMDFGFRIKRKNIYGVTIIIKQIFHRGTN